MIIIPKSPFIRFLIILAIFLVYQIIIHRNSIIGFFLISKWYYFDYNKAYSDIANKDNPAFAQLYPFEEFMDLYNRNKSDWIIDNVKFPEFIGDFGILKTVEVKRVAVIFSFTDYIKYKFLFEFNVDVSNEINNLPNDVKEYFNKP